MHFAPQKKTNLLADCHPPTHAPLQTCLLDTPRVSGAPQTNQRRLSPTSEPRQAPPRYRAPISMRTPTVLIMDGPGRLVRARRDRDRAGSGGKRAPTRKPRLLFRLSVVFLLRLAVRRFCGLLFQEPPRTTRRQGAVQASRALAGSNRPPRKIAWRSATYRHAQRGRSRLSRAH